MTSRIGVLASIVVGAWLASGTASAADEVRYTTHIKQIFGERCAACHGSDSPEHGDFKKDKEGFVAKGVGPRMDTFPHLLAYVGWPDSGAVMRRLDDGKNTKDGKPGNMYQHLGQDEAERQKNLAVFKAWVGNWTLKRFGDLTKDDLAGIKAKY